MRVLEQAPVLSAHFLTCFVESEFTFVAWRSTLDMPWFCLRTSPCQELDSSHPANTGGVLSSVAEQPLLGKR